MTEYIVLVKDEGGWTIYGYPVKASSTARAIKAAEPEEGEYVAIPARSWRPVTVKVEKRDVVTIG